MSYCRFSSDNHNCDLYCYESDGGFVTYTAGSRLRVWFRLLQWLTDKRYAVHGHDIRHNRGWVASMWRWPTWLTMKPIRHPMAGKYFSDETEEAMYGRIILLHREGFHVPKGLLLEAHLLQEAE